MSTQYLHPVMGGKWAVSRCIHHTQIYLLERSYIDDEGDILIVFAALAIPATKENTNRYFPINQRGDRCPTLELLELFATIGMPMRDAQKEIGV